MTDTPIFGIESSRDENLERMIRDIAGSEVSEKVEKFKEEYQDQKKNDVFNKLVKNILKAEK